MPRPDAAHGAAEAAPFGERWVGRLVWLCGALSTLLILVALVVTVYAIVMRYVFERPLLWVDELTGYGLVALIMLGMAEAYRRGDHIGIDLLTGRVQGRARRGLAAWADAAVLGFAVVLGWSTWDAISFARAFGSYSAGHIEIETWIPQVPLLIGAVLLGLLAAARLLGRVLGGRA